MNKLRKQLRYLQDYCGRNDMFLMWDYAGSNIQLYIKSQEEADYALDHNGLKFYEDEKFDDKVLKDLENNSINFNFIILNKVEKAKVCLDLFRLDRATFVTRFNTFLSYNTFNDLFSYVNQESIKDVNAIVNYLALKRRGFFFM